MPFSEFPKIRKIIPFVLLSIIFFQCNTPSRDFVKNNFSFIKEIRTLRVLLEANSRIQSLKFRCNIILRTNQKNLAEIKSGESLQIYRKNNLIEVWTKKTKYTLEYVDIYPDADKDLLDYKSKSYRGIFRIKTDDKNVLLLNVVGVEDYLKAVIYPEMGPARKTNDFEALKAFAVCLRNYTYMKISENKGEFDLYPDSRDQVYNGVSGEKTFTNRAIIETNNLVLEYNGQLAKTFYYSSCGGYTENSDNVFSEKGIQYLSGLKDGNEAYCNISPGFNWTEVYSSAELIAMLKKAKYLDDSAYKIKKIVVKSRFTSGRVNELEITVENTEDQLKDLFLIGNSIRSIIRSKQSKGLLRSTLFEIEPEYKDNNLKSLKIMGKGNGHGVGFCQWGAIAQSRSGRKFDELLYFYFPGTKLSEI